MLHIRSFHGESGMNAMKSAMLVGCVILLATAGCRSSGTSELNPAQQAIEYEEQGEYDLAKKEYCRAIRETPDDSRLYVNLGGIYVREEDDRNAERMFKTAIEKNPRDPLACNRLAALYYHQGKIRKAIYYYEKALEIAPDLPDVHWNLAAAYRSLEVNDKAAQHYRRYIELAPKSEGKDVEQAKQFLASEAD